MYSSGIPVYSNGPQFMHMQHMQSTLAPQSVQHIPQRVISRPPPPPTYQQQVPQLAPLPQNLLPPQQQQQQQQQQFLSSPPSHYVQQTQSPPTPQIVHHHQPLEKPIVILNSDLQTKSRRQQNELPQIVDNTDVQLLESLNLKIERLVAMEGILNQQISQKISSSNAKEVLIGQIRDQRQKLEEIVRLQTIRVEELRSASTRAHGNLDTTVTIMNDTEKEISNLKFIFAEKEKVVNQWKSRGADVERIHADIDLLRSQLSQLQAQNQILRNNIKLDPAYNYIII